jgi:hypothetical protein
VKVEDVFQIKGRGTAIATKLDNKPVLYIGQLIFRVSDGHLWEVAGVERQAIVGTREGMPLGILLKNDDVKPEAGDEIERY